MSADGKAQGATAPAAKTPPSAAAPKASETMRARRINAPAPAAP